MPVGLTDCAGTCVNTDTNLDNCGTCSNACPVGEGCTGGACVLSCPTGFDDCGAYASTHQPHGLRCLRQRVRAQRGVWRRCLRPLVPGGPRGLRQHPRPGWTSTSAERRATARSQCRGRMHCGAVLSGACVDITCEVNEYVTSIGCVACPPNTYTPPVTTPSAVTPPATPSTSATPTSVPHAATFSAERKGLQRRQQRPVRIGHGQGRRHPRHRCSPRGR